MQADGNVSVLRHLARRLGAGRALRRYYHTPMGRIKRSILEGGPWEQSRTELGRRQMIEWAQSMRPLVPYRTDRGWQLQFLSGEKYWYQTLFCYASLHRHSDVQITPVIYDDGTFSDDTVEHLRSVIPWLQLVSHDEILARLDQTVPPAKYPALRERRITQPLLRKITDLHIGDTGWKLLLDSDMLFFGSPRWLLDWLEGQKRPAYMVDCIESYGYSRELLSRLANQHLIPTRANIGFFGWKSEELDVDWLEYVVRTLIAEEGPRYNLTQAIAGMMFSGRDCDVAPVDDYVVLPSLREGRDPSVVMHHYVAHSKRSYFQHGWRRAIETEAVDSEKNGLRR